MLENKKDLSKHRLETARETMRSAKYNYEGKFYRDAINRAYYVVFYAIKAVLALDGKKSRIYFKWNRRISKR